MIKDLEAKIDEEQLGELGMFNWEKQYNSHLPTSSASFHTFLAAVDASSWNWHLPYSRLPILGLAPV